MSEAAANRPDLTAAAQALDLFRDPSRAAALRSWTLPAGVGEVIRVAAGDEELAESLARQLDAQAGEIREACTYYAHTILFHQHSDHFRVLGAGPDTDPETLKRHFRWLQKWLHPDRDPEGWVSVYAERVNAAWNVLRHPERRAAYREQLDSAEPVVAVVEAPRPMAVYVAPARNNAPAISSRWARRLPALLVGGLTLGVVGLYTAHRIGQSVLDAGQRPIHVAEPSTVAEQPTAPELALPAAAVPNEPAIETSITPAPLIAASTPPETAAIVRPVEPAPEPSQPVPTPIASTPTPIAAVSEPPETVAILAGPESNRELSRPVLPEPDRESPTASAAPATVAVTPEPVPPAPLPAAATIEPEPAPVVAMAPSPAPANSVAVAPPSTPVATRPADPVPANPEPSTPTSSIASAQSVAASARVEVPSPAVAAVPAPVPAVSKSAPPQELVGQMRSLLTTFSNAYREGRTADLVVLFTPNARTPAGNLLALHDDYTALLQRSSRRSLEFLNVEWSQAGSTLRGTGHYEWAMRPKRGGPVRSQSGTVELRVELNNGQALIAALDQRARD